MKRNAVFVFTGEGSEYFGMGQQFYEAYPIFQSAFGGCSAPFKKYLGIQLEEVIWRDSTLLLRNSPAAIFCIEFCIFQVWKSLGISPDWVLGHGVGEFCAAVCAGILSLEDGFKLVVKRSHLLNSL